MDLKFFTIVCSYFIAYVNSIFICINHQLLIEIYVTVWFKSDCSLFFSFISIYHIHFSLKNNFFCFRVYKRLFHKSKSLYRNHKKRILSIQRWFSVWPYTTFIHWFVGWMEKRRKKKRWMVKCRKDREKDMVGSAIFSTSYHSTFFLSTFLYTHIYLFIDWKFLYTIKY